MGYRKLIAVVVITIIAVYLANKGFLNEVVSDFLKWLYGIFAVSNTFEHIFGNYDKRKKDIDSTISNMSSDELRRTAENELRNN